MNRTLLFLATAITALVAAAGVANAAETVHLKLKATAASTSPDPGGAVAHAAVNSGATSMKIR
ncbi:hypothetical protein OJ997_03355 [Solirubrobacter phytolaccae]|uniref:ABC transporter substrate-binding protein n=1 Tax=Solirubrobacter phytolaccae TaxID=1404360 RepID=A0A9X3N432_9ACTN|nr:hypothetical protein [Solirubrobacter phytolaccae]MDA0179323.1 hypothetical protein [Solirubrobacter phytolaccae]